jgi:hypothetical protein
LGFSISAAVLSTAEDKVLQRAVVIALEPDCAGAIHDSGPGSDWDAPGIRAWLRGDAATRRF